MAAPTNDDQSKDFPPTCINCGAINFSAPKCSLNHAVLEDGGREWWVSVEVKCNVCGFVNEGEYGAVGTPKAHEVTWRSQMP